MVGEKGMKLGELATELHDKVDAEILQRLAPAYRAFKESPLFDPAKLAGGTDEVLDNSFHVAEYLEDVAPLNPNMEGLRTHLDSLKAIMRERPQLERDHGLVSNVLDAIHNQYYTRVPVKLPVATRGVKSATHALDPSSPFQIHRAEFTDVPGGTATMQRMSIDSEISGIVHNKTSQYYTGGGKPSLEALEHVRKVMRDRYGVRGMSDPEFNQLATRIATLDPLHSVHKVPMYGLNPVEAAYRRMAAGDNAIVSATVIRDALTDNAKLLGEVSEGTVRTVSNVIKELRGIDQEAFASLLIKQIQDSGPEGLARVNEAWRKAGQRSVDMATESADLAARTPPSGPVTGVQALATLDQMHVGDDLAKNLTKYLKAYTLPDEVAPLVQGLDKFLNMWKSSVTVLFPAFHARNFISGQFQNFLGNAFDPHALGPMRYIQPVLDADALMGGPISKMLGRRAIAGWDRIPVLKGAKTPEEAMQRLQDLAWTHKVLRPHQTLGGESLGATRQMGGMMPGVDPIWAGKPAGTTLLQRSNPAQMLMRDRATQPAVLGWERIGENTSALTEGYNRLAPWIAYLKQGIEPGEAARRVGMLQVDYGKLSKFERNVMRRLVPFYSFSRRTLPFILESLIETPGGKLAQTLRTMNRARGSNALTPDYVAETASIPLGQQPDGSDRYLTGFGLMFEDAFQFAGGPRQGGLEALSRLNPLLKTPLEMATGQSFFQKGPMGGRPIEDLDPTIGRIAANLTGRDEAVRYPGSQAAEALLSATPLSRAATSLRTATDPRKGLLGRAANLGTGFRISDVSPGSQDTILRERAEVLMKELGAKTFQRTYFPEERKEKMSPNQLLKAMELQALQNELARRAKERKAARAALEKAARR
jgi:hypothetical protein